MRPRTFASQDIVYHGPTPDIGDLPCQRVQPGVIKSVWELTPEERIGIAEGADVELWIYGEPIPPVMLQLTTEPKFLPRDNPPTPAQAGG